MWIRFIILFAVIYLLYRMVKFFSQAKSVGMNDRKSKSTPTVGEDLVEDLSCHTYIPVSQAYKKEINGKDYYFCCKECYENYISEISNERH
jgi:YHS domain-containing protein